MGNRGKPPDRRKHVDPVLVPPPQIEQLRNAGDAIDPARTYTLKMPDGSVFSATGADLLRTAGLMVSLADAAGSGNEEAMRRALEGLLENAPDD